MTDQKSTGPTAQSERDRALDDEIDTEAGSSSPHLDEEQQRQAGERAPPGAIVIHEIVREQGLDELARSGGSLAWSGLAAGLSIGFSFVAQSTLTAMLPDTPWRPMVTSFGYALGFLIVILGRQQLFTETTLTALIPALTQRTRAIYLRTMRVWLIVLFFNLAATWIFGFILSRPDMMPKPTIEAMHLLAAHAFVGPFWHTVIMAGAAGWIIGLMVWLLPAAGAAQPFIIIILTYTISLCGFPHIIAGSVESSFAVFTGQASVADYFGRFLAPTLLGNTLGGTLLAALLNHAPVAEHLRLVRKPLP
ncbi:MAG TPA: formate/nitrite transporter family protein [Acidisoma sp.]|uniref:formate/nitrite transporter family protein n=1 Tax=Acidisoma sp. TaxID=1872115 RepID=UPI002C681E7A|nr:formate/nitrite transporter family protein [Acidisoma sp.]HTI01826.1 formate/nitrite transporter family protein [Acidisoma sp.]